MESIIHKLRDTYPHITFTEADIHSWSPKEQRITYYVDKTEGSLWATLHELGHALLGHKTYDSDLALLRMEVSAWEKAAQLAAHHRIAITDDHIQSCLDTYRDWLHKRSTCPKCEHHGIQRSAAAYSCFNCQTTWRVSADRFCRPYRLTER
jgi:hypothetical protein